MLFRSNCFIKNLKDVQSKKTSSRDSKDVQSKVFHLVSTIVQIKLLYRVPKRRSKHKNFIESLKRQSKESVSPRVSKAVGIKLLH